VFDLKVLRVEFRTRAKVLLGVCEEVMRAGADQVGAAYLRGGEGEIGGLGMGVWAHELVWEVSAEGLEEQ
jgi:hypothetical protein